MNPEIPNPAVRVAVVDSGVSPDHPWLERRVCGGAGFCEDAGRILDLGGFEDSVGHGTAVASVAHAFCPEALIYAVRVWGIDQGSSEFEISETMLAHAVRHCVDAGVRIVNLSMSMKQTDPGGPLDAACAAAAEGNCILIASYKSDGGVWYPAALPGVLGVRWDLKCVPGEVIVLSRENADIATWGGPLQLASKGNTFMFSKGASYACPSIAGLVARMRTIDPDIDLAGVVAHFAELQDERGLRGCA